MKRKEFIFEKLREMDMGTEGISAGELAKRLGLNRANVSRGAQRPVEGGKGSEATGEGRSDFRLRAPRGGLSGFCFFHHPGPVGGDLRQPEDGL